MTTAAKSSATSCTKSFSERYNGLASFSVKRGIVHGTQSVFKKLIRRSIWNKIFLFVSKRVVLLRRCGAYPFWRSLFCEHLFHNVRIRNHLRIFIDLCAVVLYGGSRQREHSVVLDGIFLGVHFTHSFGGNALERTVFVP